MNNIKILIFSLLFITTSVCSQNMMLDVVYLKSDTSYKGRVIEIIPNDYLRIVTLDDSSRTFLMRDVIKIRKELTTYNPSDLSNTSYFEWGFNMGLPIGINMRFAYTKNSYYGSLSGAYLGRIGSGIQGNFGYKILNNYRWNHGPSLYAGYAFQYTSPFSGSNIKDVINYYGIAYMVSWKRLYVELGYGRLTNTLLGRSYTVNSPVFQIGYTKRIVGKEYKQKAPKNFY